MKISKLKPVLLLVAIFFILIAANFGGNKNIEFNFGNNDNLSIFNNPTVAEKHDPILINGNGELATFIGNEGLSGAGTFGDPYIIEDFTIDSVVGSGIEIRNTDAFLIIRNCIITNTGTIDEENPGIYIRSSSNITIANCTLDNNERAIASDGSSSDITIINNTILNTNSFALTASGLQNKVLNNTLMYTNCAAIELFYSENTVVTGNIMIGNHQGISVAHSNFNNISENDIMGTFNEGGDGIGLIFSNENNITRNKILGHNVGIKLESSDINSIHYNDVYGNNVQASEDRYSANNQWDNGTTGNYWGNEYIIKYPGATNDGTFWNTPYEIDGENLGIDNFPLVNSIYPNFESPTFTDTPGDFGVNVGYSGITISWTVSDLNPATYTIELDGIEVVTTTGWVSGTAISYDIPDGMPEEFYNITIIVLDESGNIAQNTAIFMVTDEEAPQFTDIPGDFSADEGYSGLTISWTATDLHPTTYIIELNGTEEVSATEWTSGAAISYNVPDGLLGGNHSITIILSDESGKTSQDSVIFTVNSEEPKIPGFPLLNLLIFISVGVFLLRRKVIHRRIRK